MHADSAQRRGLPDRGVDECPHHFGCQGSHVAGANGVAPLQSFAECARLAGAAQALRDGMGYVLRWPFVQRLLDADLAAARAALGQEVVVAAYSEGYGLDQDAAVAYATGPGARAAGPAAAGPASPPPRPTWPDSRPRA
jgi:hypothetical protein